MATSTETAAPSTNGEHDMPKPRFFALKSLSVLTCQISVPFLASLEVIFTYDTFAVSPAKISFDRKKSKPSRAASSERLRAAPPRSGRSDATT